ncbi:glycoside hydrolase family 13 protein [Rhizoctonia solani AG-1 IA]|uniref:alpha-amylase n=1 Tax=Thanatephorus cucumeris (strain AG1-IA) TaxID=983506 RepID=L8WR57_THACA|nr:glycoside hydrolase family 13 protein [Rhizoctonia solani AG-1 IA]
MMILRLTKSDSVDVSLSGGHSCTSAVIIQMFEWSWDSIAAECTDFIGPAGYGFVQVRSTLKPTNKCSNWAQVSPPSEHIEGPQWWTDYQPVSYTLTSKRGNRKQFRRAGVGVIVDTIFNHMSAMENGTGVAGSPHYNYPGIYQPQNFHNCGLNPGNDIADYTNRADVQNCELLNLAEYEATETEYVRSRLATYANDLLSLGVVGFRVDAAKRESYPRRRYSQHFGPAQIEALRHSRGLPISFSLFRTPGNNLTGYFRSR